MVFELELQLDFEEDKKTLKISSEGLWAHRDFIASAAWSTIRGPLLQTPKLEANGGSLTTPRRGRIKLNAMDGPDSLIRGDFCGELLQRLSSHRGV